MPATTRRGASRFRQKTRADDRPRTMLAAIRRPPPRTPCLRLDGKQGNALPAEFPAGALVVLGGELILRVCLALHDLQASPFDVAAIIVLLRGPADAGCP